MGGSTLRSGMILKAKEWRDAKVEEWMREGVSVTSLEKSTDVTPQRRRLRDATTDSSMWKLRVWWTKTSRGSGDVGTVSC